MRSEFLDRFAALPDGAFDVDFEGRRYSVSVHRSADGRRARLFAEELGGPDHVSFNLFRLEDGRSLLKPCEMPAQKVERFVESLVLPGGDEARGSERQPPRLRDARKVPGESPTKRLKARPKAAAER